MGATLTLTRPSPARSAPSTGRLLPPPPPLGTVRASLLCAMVAGAAFAVASSSELVSSFGGSVRTLGGANRYLDDAATIGGWLLLVAALLLAAHAAGTGLRRGHRPRLGLAVAAVGAVCQAAGAGCLLARDALGTSKSKGWLASATKVTATGQEAHHLVVAASWLAVAGLALLAAGTIVAATAAKAALRRALGVLATGLVLIGVGAVGTATIVTFQWGATQGQVPTQAQLLVSNAPVVLGWLLVASASLLVAGALRRRRSTSPLAVAGPVGAVGALALAVWSATVLAYGELLLRSGTVATSGWFVTLSKVGAAAAWAGWLLVAVAFGVAAAAVHERATRVVTEPASPRFA